MVANEQYMVGMSTRVTSVETVSPQHTVIPSERHISEPSPLPTASGTMPSTVVSVVIS